MDVSGKNIVCIRQHDRSPVGFNNTLCYGTTTAASVVVVGNAVESKLAFVCRNKSKLNIPTIATTQHLATGSLEIVHKRIHQTELGVLCYRCLMVAFGYECE